MKLLSLLVIIVSTICSGTAASAQFVDIGFRVGMNSGSATIDPEISLDARTGLTVGALVDIGLADWMGIQGEIQYTQRGARLAIPTTIGTVKGTYQLDYIQFPLVVKGSYGTAPVRAYLLTGPSLGLLFSARATGTVAGQDTTADLKNDFRSTEVSLEIGGGTEIIVSPGMMIATDIRYGIGLSNNLTQSNFPIPLDQMKLDDIKLTVAVIFRL